MKKLMQVLGIIMVAALLLGSGTVASILAAPAIWSVPMTATTATEGSNTNLEFGTNTSATDGYDSGIDVPHPPPILPLDAYFLIVHPTFPKLDKDYRAEALSIAWALNVSSSAEAITLTWDDSSMPANVLLRLTGTGIDIDMRAQGNTVLAAGSHSLTITATVNTPPVLSNGAVQPTSGYVTTSFTYSVTYTDANNHPPSSITVSIDSGAPQPMTVKAGQDGVYTNGEIYEYSISGLVKNVAHTFEFAASDGIDSATGDTGVQSGPTVANSPPTAPVVDVTPNSPVTTDDLVCTVTTPSTDVDAGDTITYTYEWYRDQGGGFILQPGLTTTTTALSANISSSNTAKGDVWRCVVTPNDGTADGPTDQDEVTIQNTSPTAPVVDVTPNSPVTTDDLVCTVTTSSTDPDAADTITYTYEWYRDQGGGFVLQSGLTTTTTALSANISSSNTTKGEVWRCIVTPNDGTVYGPTNQDEVTIQNCPPTAPIVDVTPNSPVTTDDLVCTVTTSSTDPDAGDTITYTYEWYRDQGGGFVLQSGLTTTTTALSASISSSNTTKGEVWRCIVTPNDGTVDGPTDQDEVTIQNSPPTAPVVDVTPNLPLTTDNLVCAITTTSTDPDDDSVTYSYAWYKDTVLQLALTTNTVTSANTAEGEVWRCVVTPYDGTDYGLTGDDQVTIVVEIQISLKAGWNMVSVPVTPQDTSTASVFAGAEVVYTWNPTTKSYYSPTEVEPNKGYFVAVLSDTVISVWGVPVYNWTTDITAGWNMIGSVFDNVGFTDPQDSPDGRVEAFGYWWNPVTKSYVFTTTIEPEKGYWIAATQNCTLTLSTP